jgi:hypothetical protein
VTPLEVDEVLDRIEGEFEVTLDDDQRAIWTTSIAHLDKDQCIRAIDKCMDRYGVLPNVATFRTEAIAQGRKSFPKERCHCLDGWELPTEENYVVACRACTAGEMKAALVEQYREQRAEWRRKHRTPELLPEKPAQHAAEWADQAREWLANGMPEPEPVPAGNYYERDEEF